MSKASEVCFPLSRMIVLSEEECLLVTSLCQKTCLAYSKSEQDFGIHRSWKSQWDWMEQPGLMHKWGSCLWFPSCPKVISWAAVCSRLWKRCQLSHWITQPKRCRYHKVSPKQLGSCEKTTSLRSEPGLGHSTLWMARLKDLLLIYLFQLILFRTP